MDKRTSEQKKYNMQQVKCKGSQIENLLMKELWSRGLRYRKNVKSVFGKPDIAFIGKNKKMTLSLIKSFGSRKSKEI